jgi:ADP-ribosylglycohydrolase
MSISWINIRELVKHELQQQEDEGRNVAKLKKQWERLVANVVIESLFAKRAEKFYRELLKWKVPTRVCRNEPSDFRAIRSLSTAPREDQKHPSLTTENVHDKILGGWLGRSAGCMLGKPVEKMTREGIRKLLLLNGTWPIRDYITEQGIPQKLLKRELWNRHSGRESLKENIVCMTEDDDMNYPMLNLSIVEQYGKDFTAEDVAQAWLSNLPALSTFTAERVAYVNCLNGLLPPETAIYRNPYREWIGAQIRADLWGWISPAQPARAAALAWRDARVSHVGNGMYGEMYFAAAIAASFECKTVNEVITKALQYIPPRSRLADAIRFVESIPIRSRSWDETVSVLYEQFGQYHWVHTINNAALVVAALISSEGDFETGICNVVMGGLDTDSDGATVGSILGTLQGATRLPSKWIEPLNNRIRSSLRGFDNAFLSDLAKRTTKIASQSINI